MKKDKDTGELRPEYRREDLGKGVRGKYYKSYVSARNLVLLEPEVAKVFPDDKSANEALKSLIKIAQAATRQKAK